LDAIPRLDEVSLDATVLGFALAAAIVTGVLASLMPARAAVRRPSWGTSRARSAPLASKMVIGEIALTAALLWGAGLLGQTFRHLQRADLGFDPHHVLTFSLLLPDSNEPDGRKEAAFDERVMESLQRIPGVESVAATTELPIFGLSATMEMKIAGHPAPLPSEPKAELRVVSTGYFATMGMAVRRGRNFTDRDRWGAPGVAIVNEAAARRYFGGQDPVGQRLMVPQFAPGMRDAGAETPREIVGVVGDVRQYSLKDDAVPHLYLPLEQNAVRYTMFAVRTKGRPEDSVAAVQRVVGELDRDLPAAEFASMDARMAFLTSQARTSSTLFALFALLALLLAAVGIYSVLSGAIRRRTHEIGIRMSIGARRRDVLIMVLREAVTWTVCGLALGGVLLAACARLIENYLFGVRTTDSATAAGVAAALLVLAVGAACVPACRAAQVDPMVALRHD